MEIPGTSDVYTKKFFNLLKRDGTSELLSSLLILDISQAPFEASLIEVNENKLSFSAPKVIMNHASVAKTLDDFFDECRHKYPPKQECIIVALPREYHSLKLSFPFNDPEQIEKLLPQELEELCPFDPSDFIASFAMTSNGSELSSSVHVSLITKTTISEILTSAQKFGFDPVSIIPPTLGARPINDSFSGYESVIFSAGSIFGIAVLKEGVCLFDNICKREELSKAVSQIECLFKIERFSLIGVSPDEVTSLNKHHPTIISTIFSPRSYLALNASISSLQSIRNKRTTINFRKNEFQVSYDFIGLFSEIFKHRNKILATLLICSLCLSIVVVSYKIRITQEEKQLRTSVGKVLPEVLQSTESPLVVLKNKTQSLEQQLKDLGSPFSLSPIEALEIFSKDLPASSEIEVKNITVKGKLISIQGMSSGYAPVERLKRDLEKKKRIYCSDVKTQLKGSSGFSRGGESKNEFSLEVTLCD